MNHCATLVVSLALLVMHSWFASIAGAQPCDVSVGEEVILHTDSPVMVRMAWDRAADVPAVLWLDSSSNEIAFKRWVGPGDADWDATPTVVDKGTVHTPPAFDWGGWRMIALDFDSQGMAHLLISGEETAGCGTMALWYVHQMPEAGWTSPVRVHDLPATASCDWEPFVDAQFDSHGRLHVASHNYGGEGEVAVFYMEDGVWSAAETILTNAAGMDMAVGADDTIHVITIRRTTTGSQNQYQAFYKGRSFDEDWSEDNGTQITFEPEIDCIAGPLACWPSVTTDRAGHPHIAYGVDPDPCQPEELYRYEGHLSYTRMTGDGTWTTPEVVLEQTELHGPLPEMIVDPTGVKYALVTNRDKRVAFDALDGVWQEASWHGSGSMWFTIDSVASGDGGWMAYEHDGANVGVVHFQRTGDCADAEDCEPGYEQVCGLCGVQTCGKDALWGPCTDEGECYPETSGSCGDGGEHECGWDCMWSPCYGECEPVQVQDCGNCGSQTCLEDTSWGECTGEGECAPGEVEECLEGGDRTCTDQCEWDSCPDPAGDDDDEAGGCDCSAGGLDPTAASLLTLLGAWLAAARLRR